MPTLSVMETMLGNAELGRLLAVTRQRVSQIVSSPDFPPPRLTLAMGSIWALDDVIAWADARGRTLHLDTITTDVKANGHSSPQSKSES